jgi:hypothetical protein
MTTAIDPLQQSHVDRLELEVRQILQQMDELYTEFAALQRKFFASIDQLKAKRDAMLPELYQ